MKIELNGLNEAIEELKKIKKRAPNAIEDWVDGHGDDALQRVKMRTPVRTPDGGDLRREWEKQPVEKTGDNYSQELTNPVEYLPHVEWGHRIIDRNGKYHGVQPGVFMARTSKEITEEAMKADKDNLIKRIIKP